MRSSQRALVLALTLAIVFGGGPLWASELSFPEHGFSLNLPGDWRIGDQSIVEAIDEANPPSSVGARGSRKGALRCTGPATGCSARSTACIRQRLRECT